MGGPEVARQVVRLVWLMGALGSTPSWGATFTVTSTADAPDAQAGDGICETAPGPGACTLRAALEEANARPGPDVIHFRIRAAKPVVRITPGSPLPAIRGAVSIDGYTQPGARPASATADAVLAVELDGTATTASLGLQLAAGSAGSVVKGLAINGFDDSAILIESDGNTVQGNHLGTNARGTVARPNLMALSIFSSHNLVGGPEPAARNLLSGNREVAVELAGAAVSENVLQGNYVGVGRGGRGAVGNGGGGVRISSGAQHTRVVGNVIAGNAGPGGILITTGATGTTVVGNLIGLGRDGTTALGNAGYGIYISSGSHRVGGHSARERNVISANGSNGIFLFEGATSNVVQGNYVGLTADGRAKRPNGGAGVRIRGSAHNLIGGDTAVEPGASNVISGNAIGVRVDGAASGNVVQGNFIGTGPDGTSSRGNALAGVLVESASDNTIGGETAKKGNTIAYNGGPGVVVDPALGPATGNLVVSNAIFRNRGLAIDLGSNGRAEDAFRHSYPVIRAAPGDASIAGTYFGAPNRTYLLQFFESALEDPDGGGEAERLLKSLHVTASPNGRADFAFEAPDAAGFVTASATDLTTYETSELAPNVAFGGGRNAAARAARPAVRALHRTDSATGE